ncbi:MAG: flavodoxin family protein [Candidatus Omnitrophica bacterium]|nr:flavodoxin family protein [Candidatus Omnitrophota bacterium]
MKNKKLNLLAIAASPRRNGNSETLLDRAVVGVREKGLSVKKIILSELDIKPCIAGCGACYRLGECVIEDDMQALYRDLLTLDVLLVSAPIYFQGLPAQLKCAIDRCQALWARKFILKKGLIDKRLKARRRGGAILVCASRNVKNTFTGAIITLKAWYNTLDIHYKKEFLTEGLEAEADALKHKELLRGAMRFGRVLAERRF